MLGYRSLILCLLCLGGGIYLDAVGHPIGNLTDGYVSLVTLVLSAWFGGKVHASRLAAKAGGNGNGGAGAGAAPQGG